MAESNVERAPAPLSCEQCLTDLPDSVSHTCEGDEYIHYYCGLDCYQKWLAQQDSAG